MKVYLHTNLYVNVYSRLIQNNNNNKKVEATLVVYPYNEHEVSADTYNKMDEPWKYYDNLVKSNTKAHMLYDIIYIICPE